LRHLVRPESVEGVSNDLLHAILPKPRNEAD
jgi:hypothetical protein